jgi:hypothetical protein
MIAGMVIRPEHLVTSAARLAELYDPPTERVVHKVIDRLDTYCRALIAASPFLVMGTCNRSGALDCSPRGDRPGFVRVADDQTLLIPDRRGNNRIDSIRNLLESPAVGLFFLVPGVNETLRVNGSAVVSADPELTGPFAVDGRPPKTVIVVTVREAFMQCGRALLRSGLWDPAGHVRREALPSMGTILAAHTGGRVDAEAYDAEATTRIPKTLY